MKVLPIQLTKYSPNFGELDEPYDFKDQGLPEVKMQVKKKQRTEALINIKKSIINFNYTERMGVIREAALNILDESISGRHLNIFEKMLYSIRKSRISKIKI